SLCASVAGAAPSCARTAPGAAASMAKAQTVETSRRRMEALPETSPGTIDARTATRKGMPLELPPAVARIAFARVDALLAPGDHHQQLVAADAELAGHGDQGAQRGAAARLVEEARELGHADPVAAAVDRQLRYGDDIEAVVDRHPHLRHAE